MSITAAVSFAFITLCLGFALGEWSARRQARRDRAALDTGLRDLHTDLRDINNHVRDVIADGEALRERA